MSNLFWMNETDEEAKVLPKEQAERNTETVSENEIEDLDVGDKEQRSKSETVPDDSISNIEENVSDNDIGNIRETVFFEIILEEGITRIGDYAFAQCRGITEGLVIPSSVTSIGKAAFTQFRGWLDNKCLRYFSAVISPAGNGYGRRSPWVAVTGKGNYAGTLSEEYRIVGHDISKARVSVPAQIYTGEEITPGVDVITVKHRGRELGEESYRIVNYSNNIDKGRAKMILKGIGEYGGTKTVKFRIRSSNFFWWLGF